MAIHHDAKPLKILLSGGGSGGHITPLLAIADELKHLKPDTVIVSVGERGSKFAHLTKQHESIDHTRSIFAGKFRRYHKESFVKRVLDFHTIFLNIRDAFLVVIGIVQSIVLVKKEKPDLVFLKGGFVGVPIGIAARLWNVPIVTHDSDAMPGLANRIVGRWARVHATGMPASFYAYPEEKVAHVGVLVSKYYGHVGIAEKAAFRQDLGIPDTNKMLFVTGGSLGAQRINTAVIAIVDRILTTYPDVSIVHQVGRGNIPAYKAYTHPRLTVLEFLDGMHRYSGSADVIVTRAGANTIAEFGVQGKACIVIPSPQLAGGHQLKNGDYLTQMHAAKVIDEAAMVQNPELLLAAIHSLLTNDSEREQLARTLHEITISDATHKLAVVLLDVAENK